ncbi:MAG: hypothetical protein LBD84_07155, partial [Campylobacteraceae bacterium]|nr:hypothetical protein [Campylobacteraceae bacterium]
MDCIDRIVSRSAKYAKQLPNLNKIITAIYNGDRDFPPYVFLPSKEWVRIFFLENFNTDEAPFKIPVDNVMQGITVLNWRYSQGVYIFEPEIRDVLLDTKLPDAFPMEVFKRLPEWCLYIPVEIQFFGEEIHGFYAYLDFIENEDYLVISIDGKDDFTVLPIKISNKPIVE